MSFFGSLPSFTHGQALSAAFHANNLQRYVQGIRDAFVGIQTPFIGNVKVFPWEYEAALRHKVDSLYYSVEIAVDNAFAQLYIDDVLKVTFDGNGIYSGTLDVSALALNQFYVVSIKDGYGGAVRMNLLREQETVSLPALASFADGTTPTAAQWQALATYATTLAGIVLPPVAPIPQVASPVAPVFSGYINHRCRYLAYRWFQQRPYHGEDTWISTKIRLNGVPIMHRRNGYPTSDAGVDFDQSSNADGTWSGVVDLDTYPGTLIQGQEYAITVTEEDNGTSDPGIVRLDYLYETPAAEQSIAGWTPFENWAHGDYAWGSANPGPGMRQISDIKANLELIGALLSTYLNPASVPYLFGGEQHYGPRSRRFLHYRNFANETGSISWSYREEPQQASLPSAEDRWLSLDMESLEGLWPGTLYQLNDMRFAIEDNDS